MKNWIILIVVLLALSIILTREAHALDGAPYICRRRRCYAVDERTGETIRWRYLRRGEMTYFVSAKTIVKRGWLGNPVYLRIAHAKPLWYEAGYWYRAKDFRRAK